MLRKQVEFGFVRQLIVWLLVFLFPIVSWAEEGAQKWACETGGYVYSSPAIGADGIIYVGSDDKKLYAIDPDRAVNPDGTMTPKWVFETDNRVYSSPAVGADGTIYVGSHDFKLYAINPNGTKKWEFVTGSWVESSPAIGADGTIYVGSWDKYLYAVNPDGTEKWAFETGGYVKSSPAIGSDGTIYVGSDDHNLYAINSDGTQKWVFETENRVRSSPAIGADGTICVGSDDCNLYAINPSGTKKWEFATGGFVYSSPAIGSDGTIYAGSDDKKVYAINPDGTKKWEFTTGGLVYSSPAIGADGTIYVGSNDDRLYAISSDGDATGSFETGGYVWSSPVIGDDGTVYVGSGDQNFYAVTWIPDTTPPTVNSTSPANSATDVGVNTVITATFSEVMSPSTITIATFLVSNGSGNIAGTMGCSGATASFTPTGALEYDTVYTATMSTGVEDLAGNAIESDYTWSFTTSSYTGPMISLYPVSLSNSCQGGQNAPNQSFQVWNSGGDTLSYVIEDDVAWLSCAPARGASTGEHDTITVEYATSGLASGTYSATITVSASGASNSPQTIGVTLTVGSHPPVADAGVDQTVNERNLVTLDGSGSTDPDDGIDSYHWEQAGGSPIVTLEGAGTAVASFTAPDVGGSGISLTFELTVTDKSGLQDTDIGVVDVTWENDSPTANAGPNQTVDENISVTLNG
ncbi:MAG: PQQ-binding-like beta-propeller repeat protein, partial [Deltaproteobacteria bacterium]|nr:PQQ-binding-like beta-propeller repeat protein [Deltaproteobacteria bacterium]